MKIPCYDYYYGFVIALAVASGSQAAGYQHLIDPVVTHTNGMRLASSTSTRSHNVYWRCDPNHVGYCDGQMHSPCRHDWQSLGTRHCGRFVPPSTPIGPTGTETGHSQDGLEQASGESLGLITTDPNRQPVTAGRDGVAVPQTAVQTEAAAPASGIWLDSLKTLGSKMMSPAS